MRKPTVFVLAVASLALAATVSSAPALRAETPKPAARASCEGAKVADVSATGAFLCAHCNLHIADKCAPMFRAEGKTNAVKVCPASKDAEKLTTVGKFGKEKVEVKGVLRKSAAGEEQLEITSYKVLPGA